MKQSYLMTNNEIEITELRNEISNCNQAIKAFRIGCPHLAPDGLSEAPSVKWLQMQKRLCVRKLTAIRNA